MSNRPNIIIPFPCKENWDKMLPNEQGKHCTLCAKTVVDFTSKSELEILEYFNAAKKEICGRFKNDQFMSGESYLKQLPQRARYFLYALAIVFFGLFLNPQSAEAQINNHTDTNKNCISLGGGKLAGKQYFLEGKPVNESEYIEEKEKEEEIKSKWSKGNLKFHGKIIDANGNPLFKSTLNIFRDNISVGHLTTAADGTFSFKDLAKAKYKIVAYNKAMGFKTFEILLDENLEANIILHKRKKKSKLSPKTNTTKTK